MNYKLLALFLLVITGCGFVFYHLMQMFKESNAAKMKALKSSCAYRAMVLNMYTEAKWLAAAIGLAENYAAICKIEEKLNAFALTYKECDDMEPVTIDLLHLLSMKRRLVRKMDKPASFDFTYSSES